MDQRDSHSTHLHYAHLRLLLRIAGIALLIGPLLVGLLSQSTLAARETGTHAAVSDGGGQVAAAAQQGSVNIAVSPSTASVALGGSFSVDIVVNAGTQPIDSADAHLNFNPAYIQVTAITWVSAALSEMQKQWDNTAGTVDCAGLTFGSTSGSFILCRVQFLGVGATPGTPLTFVFTPLHRKTQATYLGVDYCAGNVTHGSVTVFGAEQTASATPTATSTVVTPSPTATATTTVPAVNTPTPTLTPTRTGVVLYVSPASKTVWVGDVFSLQIRVSAGPQLVDLVEAHLDFNPVYLEVLTIVGGGVLPNELQNAYSNMVGSIDYVASTFATPPAGDFLLATVTLRAKAATAGTPLTFSFTPSTRQTKVEYLGIDRLTAANGASVAINALRAASLLISPASTSVALGAAFDLDVIVNSGVQPVDLAEAHISFDPVYLEVLGMTDGGNLSSVLQTEYNNALGSIDYAAGAFGSPPSGSFVLCRLHLRAKAFTAGTPLTFVFMLPTRQTKVEYNGSNILGTATGATVIVAPQNRVNIYVSPASKTAWVGDVFNLQIRVAAGSQPVDLVEAHLDFDPTYVEVQSLAGSGVLPNELQSIYSSVSGHIDYAASTFATPPVGDFLLATLNLRAKAATAGTPLAFVFSPTTRRTKAEYQGALVLGAASDGNVIITGLRRVDMLISPATRTVTPGDTFNLEVRLVAGAQPVDLAEAHLDFDPTYLEVLAIADGGNLTSVLQSEYNNTTGSIDYAAGTVGAPPSGSFVLCRVQLRAKALTPGTALTFVFSPSTRVTKVEYNSISVLGSTYGGTVIIAMRPPSATPTPTSTPPRVTPTTQPVTREALFQTDRDGNWEIYRTADIFNVTRLTFNLAEDAAPCWDPSGQYIAFQSNRDRNWEIYSMDSTGGSQANASRNSAADTSPSWSCQWIFFQSNRDGNWEIYRMNPDGTGQTRLTSHPAADAQPAAACSGRVAFQSKRDGNWEIYSMNPDGGDVRRLTNTFWDEASPTWSPLGDKIAFQTRRTGKWEIAVMNADGTNVQFLTHGGGDAAESPMWYPYTDWILFQGLYYGDWDVYRVNPSGTIAQRIVFGPNSRDMIDSQVFP